MLGFWSVIFTIATYDRCVLSLPFDIATNIALFLDKFRQMQIITTGYQVRLHVKHACIGNEILELSFVLYSGHQFLCDIIKRVVKILVY